MLSNLIEKQIKDTVKKLYGIEVSDFILEHPDNEKWGDYATSLPLALAKNLKKSPITIAEEITFELNNQDIIFEFADQKHKIFEKIYATAPGFINFVLSKNWLFSVLYEIHEKGGRFGSSDYGKGRKYLLEHTSPNPNKAMHLGHLRNNVTGMAIANIWEFVGIDVVRDDIDNNRGIAIAKLMWGYLKFGRKDGKIKTDIGYWYEHQDEWLTPESARKRPDRFVDEFYVNGAEDFANPEVEKQVRQLVVDWEAEEPKNRALWAKVLSYSYAGQQLTLKRLGNKWDKVWHEHDHYKKGKELVEAGVQKGIFKKLPDGAVLTDLKEYNLSDTIVQKSDGTSLYITQDLALTQLKKQTFNPDKLYWVVGPEQSLALKQLFAVCEQLGILRYADCVHIAFGYMSIKGRGKMSSRSGNVVYIDDLLDEASNRALAIMKDSEIKIDHTEVEQLTEAVGVGAVKYSILKVGRMSDIAFDFGESVSFEGDSGPYLQYTFARANSILTKAVFNADSNMFAYYVDKIDPDKKEQALLRHLYIFPEVIEKAAKEFTPNYICTYLFELGQKFNSFYNSNRVLNEPSQDLKDFRLLLAGSVSQVLKTGLALLGISSPERM